MKINGMQSMLGGLLAAAIVTGLTIVAPPATAQNSPRHYSDDAIVRDLKAGKLTVREAQMLRERRDNAAPLAAAPHPLPHKAQAPQKPHQSHKLSKHGKPAHAGKATREKKAGKAPVHHLTTLHDSKKGKPTAHVKALHGKAEHGKSVHGKSVKPGKPIKPVKAHVVKTGAADAAPVRHQAVKYIR